VSDFAVNTAGVHQIGHVSKAR